MICKPVPTAFLIAAIVVASACSTSSPSVEEVTTDGIPLLLNYYPAIGEPAGEIVDAMDVLLIDGESEDGPPEAILASPNEVAIAPNGLMYVLDGQDQRIKVFDRDGRFSTSFGGRGNGPGELQFGWRLGIWDHTIAVAEGQVGLLHLFTLEGQFIERINLQWGVIYGIVPFPGDTYLLARSYRDGNPTAVHDQVVLMRRVDRQGIPVAFGTNAGAADTLEMARVHTAPDAKFRPSFTNENILLLMGEEEVLIPGSAYTFWVVGPNGRRRAFRRVGGPYRYPEWWFDHWREYYEGQGDLDRMPQDEGVELSVSSMTLDDERHLWVVEFASLLEQFHSWDDFDDSHLVAVDEFDPDGRWLRHLVLSFPVTVRYMSLEAAADGYLFGRILAGPPSEKGYVVSFRVPEGT